MFDKILGKFGDVGKYMAIIQFVVWLVKEIIPLIQKAREKWPKNEMENAPAALARKDERRRYVDGRVAVALEKVMARPAKPEEIRALREVAYEIDKRARGRRGGKTARAKG
jgi:hypothetical protein